MKILMLGNGTVNINDRIQVFLKDVSYVICCDGGLKHAEKLNIKPDLIMGDFDSCPGDLLEKYKDTQIKKYNPIKDATDIELALYEAVNLKPTEIIIMGGMGTRFDHTLTNAHLLKIPLERSVKACVVNENNIIRLTDKPISLPGSKGDILSLIPLTTTVSGVTTEGLFYPLKDAVLEVGSSFGVSNVFTGNEAKVYVSDGLLFVIQTWD